jgi:hypothetical protein
LVLSHPEVEEPLAGVGYPSSSSLKAARFVGEPEILASGKERRHVGVGKLRHSLFRVTSLRVGDTGDINLGFLLVNGLLVFFGGSIATCGAS